MKIIARIILACLSLVNVSQAIRNNSFWDNASRGRNVGSDTATMKLLFVATPALIFIIFTLSILLLGKHKKITIAMLVISFLFTLFGMKSAEGMRLFQAEDLNILMQSDLLFGVIVLLLVLSSYILQRVKANKLVTADFPAFPQIYSHSEEAVTIEAAKDDTKECPQCAEIIKAKAKICRFCNHSFEQHEITSGTE